MSEVNASKESVRAHYLSVLEKFDFFSLIEKSARLSDQFSNWIRDHHHLLQGKTVLSYVPFGNEPQLNIEMESRNEPYQVGYVRVYDWKACLMEAHFARRDMPDMWEELTFKNGNKVFQPMISQALCGPEAVGAILIPGLSFTKEGTRLGRGAGFYDRFLIRYPQALRVGIAFEEQIANSLPSNSWDIPIDALLTDTAFYPMKSYGEWQKNGKLRLSKE